MYYIKESTDLSNIFDFNKKRIYLTTNEYNVNNKEEVVEKMIEIIKSYMKKAEEMYTDKFERWHGILVDNFKSSATNSILECDEFDKIELKLNESIDAIRSALPENSMIYIEYTLLLKHGRGRISYPLTFMTYFRVLDDVKYTELLL